jgi:acyl-CoA synthetase (AMP-forming)/AMP-acid ligase II
MCNWWLEMFSQWGEHPAVVENDQVMSYQSLAAEIRITAERLAKHGVQQQSVVVLNADFSIACIAALFALIRLRAIVIPIVETTNSRLETARLQCGADFLCKVDPELAIDAFQKASRPALYQTLRNHQASGLVLLSSGSTGTSKAILHDLDSLLAEQKVKAVRRKLTVVLILLFDHIGGINTLVRTLFAGGVALIPAERTPEAVCRLIERQRARVLPASPTFLNLILLARLHETFDLRSLRLISYGTEPMPEELLRRVRDAFPYARLLQTFGTSETGIATTSSESSSSIFFKIEDRNVSYRIVNDELQLKATTGFLGYLNHHDETLTEDGWFRTGDLVEDSGTGFIRIRGRTQEVINVAGEKILPVELETLLLQSPMIADCAVYGELNAIAGQIVCADIVPRDAAATRSEMRKHLHAFLGSKVEKFKLPSRINIVAEVAHSERFKKIRTRNPVDPDC